MNKHQEEPQTESLIEYLKAYAARHIEDKKFNRQWFVGHAKAAFQPLLSKTRQEEYEEGFKKGQKHAFGVDRERVKEEGRLEERQRVVRIAEEMKEKIPKKKGNLLNNSYKLALQELVTRVLEEGKEA